MPKKALDFLCEQNSFEVYFIEVRVFQSYSCFWWSLIKQETQTTFFTFHHSGIVRSLQFHFLPVLAFWWQSILYGLCPCWHLYSVVHHASSLLSVTTLVSMKIFCNEHFTFSENNDINFKRILRIIWSYHCARLLITDCFKIMVYNLNKKINLFN